MASLNADYTYTSQLPLMLFRITQRHSQSNNTGPKHVDRSTGMTGMQKNLWRLVWHMKDKVNVDLEFGGQHAAIRQFWCEKWVWRTYWPENTFPGVYPTRIDPVVVQRDKDGKIKVEQEQTPPSSSQNSVAEHDVSARSASKTASAQTNQLPFLAQPPTSGHLGFVSSLPDSYNYNTAAFNARFVHKPNTNMVPEMSNAYDTPGVYAIQRPLTTYQSLLSQSSPVIHHPIANPTSHPHELNLTPTNIATILSNIMRYKPTHYIPIHGWDTSTSLPRYAILNLAPDGHAAFFGPKGGDGRFQRIREEFLLFRIMFQRLDHGAVIVWTEGRTRDMCREMATGTGDAWECFGRMWAFLRTWAEHANLTGKSENIVEHFENCKSVWENVNISALVPPPPPKQHHNFNAVRKTDALGISGNEVYQLGQPAQPAQHFQPTQFRQPGPPNGYDVKTNSNQVPHAGQIFINENGGHPVGGSGFGAVQAVQQPQGVKRKSVWTYEGQVQKVQHKGGNNMSHGYMSHRS